jgi:hypothetical protein
VALCESWGEWYCNLHARHPTHEHLPSDPDRPGYVWRAGSGGHAAAMVVLSGPLGLSVSPGPTDRPARLTDHILCCKLEVVLDLHKWAPALRPPEVRRSWGPRPVWS